MVDTYRRPPGGDLAPAGEGHISVEMARMAMVRSAELFDAGVDAAEAANIAKYAAAEASLEALDQAIQTHGGNGLSKEYGLAEMWFNARLLRTAPVSREMVLNFVAQTSLGLPPLVLGEHSMTDSTLSFDALVVGAGAGGLLTAARLQHAGYRTLVVERLDKVGGRASTDEIDGFKVNNGAIVIETGGITEETFKEVGAKFDVRSPQPPILYRLGGKDVDVSSGGWGFLLGKLSRQAAKIVKGIGAARNDSGMPEDEMSTADWVSKYTKNESVHGIFRNMCGSVFAVGSEDLPARVFLTYFTRKSAFKKFGFCPPRAPSESGSRSPRPSSATVVSCG